jgi:hypothetical protein
VEDRLTPGLYLELGNLSAAAYSAERAPELLELPCTERVTWWETLVPGRSDLPSRIADGPLLGVTEVSDGFTAPDPLPGFVGHHYRRYPRPGQGILTGRPTKGLLVVWISPREPALSQKLRDWGDFVHIRHIAAAAVPGFTRITVYRNARGEDPLYMHFYELDTDDPEGAFGTMAGLVAARIGAAGSDEFEHWADYRAAGGRLFYCNTFRLLGERRAQPVASRMS